MTCRPHSDLNNRHTRERRRGEREEVNTAFGSEQPTHEGEEEGGGREEVNKAFGSEQPTHEGGRRSTRHSDP
jgi:hypothetical protein